MDFHLSVPARLLGDADEQGAVAQVVPPAHRHHLQTQLPPPLPPGTQHVHLTCAKISVWALNPPCMHLGLINIAFTQLPLPLLEYPIIVPNVI